MVGQKYVIFIFFKSFSGNFCRKKGFFNQKPVFFLKVFLKFFYSMGLFSFPEFFLMVNRMIFLIFFLLFLSEGFFFKVFVFFCFFFF